MAVSEAHSQPMWAFFPSVLLSYSHYCMPFPLERLPREPHDNIHEHAISGTIRPNLPAKVKVFSSHEISPAYSVLCVSRQVADKTREAIFRSCCFRFIDLGSFEHFLRRSAPVAERIRVLHLELDLNDIGGLTGDDSLRIRFSRKKSAFGPAGEYRKLF